MIVGITKKRGFDSATLKVINKQFSLCFGSRQYWAQFGDINAEAVLLHAEDIIQYMADGNIDAGFVPEDVCTELALNTPLIFRNCLRAYARFEYSKALGRTKRWVLAAPDETLKLFQRAEKTRPLRVATEIPRITELWASSRKFPFVVERSLGSTEAKAPRFVDGVVDCVNSGATLAANRLRIVDTVFRSGALLLTRAETALSSGLKHFCEGIAQSNCTILSSDAWNPSDVGDVLL
jgi:ATP phosphoribosyltransferase